MMLYSIECEMYLSENNLITILPYKPYNYNTQYSVVFNNFPLMIPDITNPNGFYNQSVSVVFENYFTTVPVPLNFKISFENTYSLIWCGNAISITFNRPVNLDDTVLSNMFSIIESETGTVISVNVSLSGNGTVANLIPSNHLSGGTYFLRTNMVGYTGDERLDDSYRFVVADKIVITFKSNINPNYRDPQYGYYSTFNYGDTVQFSTHHFVNDYANVFSDWNLPGVEGTNYTVDSNGILRIIFDCENYFYNNHLSEQKITITSNYIDNPIDRIVLRADLSNLPLPCKQFHLNYELSNSLTKTVNSNSDIIFTHRRYSDKPMSLYNTTDMSLADKCNMFVSNIRISTPDGTSIVIEDDKPEIILPVAPNNTNMYLNGEWIGGLGNLHWDMTYEPTSPCEIYKYTIFLHLVGESFEKFHNGDEELKQYSSKMFKTLTFNDTDYNRDYLFSDNHLIIYNIGTISVADNEITYVIEIADEYKDLYEIYNFREVHIGTTPATKEYVKHYLENPDAEGFTEKTGDLTGTNLHGCTTRVYIQIRRKIVSLDISVHKENQATSVPTYNQTHLGFLNNDNSKALKIRGDKSFDKMLIHGLSNDGVYGKRHEPDDANITKLSNSINVVTQEKTTYYFYAGDTITAEPFIREGIGYHFVRWIDDNIPVGANYIVDNKGNTDRRFKWIIPKGQKKFEGDMLLGEGFRLEYIGVQKRGVRNTPVLDKYVFYSIDKESNVVNPPWVDNDDPDKGVGLNNRMMTVDREYHNWTTGLMFYFNQVPNYNTIKTVTGENILVSDERVTRSGSNVRYDGKPVAVYKQYYNTPGAPWDDNISFPGMQGGRLMEFNLQHQLVKDGTLYAHTMSNLQPFSIRIDNVGGKIYSHSGKVLSNISDEVIVTYRNISESPQISIETSSFINNGLKTNKTCRKDLRLKVVGSLFIDAEGKTPPLQVENEFMKTDEEGRIEFQYRNRGFPENGIKQLSALGVWYNKTNFYTPHTQLLASSRIMCSFHWLDSMSTNKTLSNIIGFLTNADVLKLASSIFGLGITDGVAELIQKFGETVTKSIDDNRKKLEFLGHNTFYLGFDGISNNLNARYSHTGELYDWNLWGVGRTGLYETTTKVAYTPGFYHDGRNLHSKTDFFTTIFITLGD